MSSAREWWSVDKMFWAVLSWGLRPCKPRGWLLQVLHKKARAEVPCPIHRQLFGQNSSDFTGSLPMLKKA